MPRFVCFPIILLLAGACSSWAAGFDCAKASSATEKMICADAEISRADGELARVYADAVKMALNRPMLVHDQREWLRKRNSITDAEALPALYRERIRRLESVPRADTLQFSAKDCDGFLRRNDITDVADCRVIETGTVGAMGGRTYDYAQYCIVPGYTTGDRDCDSAGYYHRRGLAVFTREKEGQQKRLFLERGSSDIGSFVYDKPEIVRNSYGTFLYLPIRVDGTGNFNDSEYYLWNERLSEWTLLDSRSWLKGLAKRIPPGLAIWKGVWPDIATMTAEAGLYRKGDGNCCPTGGRAEIRLTLKGRKFQVMSVKIRKEVE